MINALIFVCYLTVVGNRETRKMIRKDKTNNEGKNSLVLVNKKKPAAMAKYDGQDTASLLLPVSIVVEKLGDDKRPGAGGLLGITWQARGVFGEFGGLGCIIAL